MLNSHCRCGYFLKIRNRIEEIIEEALVQNVDDFVRFMEVAAIMDGEILNYENVASDCEVSANTVKAYYKILVDTLL